MRKIYKLIRKILKIIYTYWVKRNCNSYKDTVHANYFTHVNTNTNLGSNIHFNGLKINGVGEVNIGDNFHCGKECLFLTQNHNYNLANAIPYDDTYIVKEINISDNVWLGDRVIVIGGVTIEEGAIVQAGSVVVSDIPKYSIAGGHPAKVFSKRDVEHYKKLKKEGKFH
jgi:acetyltransferase-like isoleucine patch superfamily enzyme